MFKVGDRFIPKEELRKRYDLSEDIEYITLTHIDKGYVEMEYGDGHRLVGNFDINKEFIPYGDISRQTGSTERLLGKKVFVRYVNYNTYMSYGNNLITNIREVNTKKIIGVFDNHSEPMFHIDGGDEYGYAIIPRQFIVELYELH